MDGKNTDIISSEAPNSKCTAEGNNAWVCGFRVRTLHKHAIGGKNSDPLSVALA
jgi:hypothetical protein